MVDTVAEFEAQRSSLLALAYRMLGDFGRAEDLVQEAWLRWQGTDEPIDSPRAFLVTMVTRLCLSELSSARTRREVARADRLPEPVGLDDVGIGRVDVLDQISMAFLVLLQRLTPAERAALLLHDVFDFDHAEIAALLRKSEPACRKLLERARQHVEVEKRSFAVSREEHERMLRAFLAAATTGDVAALESLLADETALVVDAGPQGGSYGRVRNLPGPLIGRKKVAAFVAAVAPQGAAGVVIHLRELNGQPAIVIYRNGNPSTVIMLAITEGLIRSIFMQADAARLRRLAAAPS